MEERLKKIRESLKKTQKEMSNLLGLGEITWQNYERGISKPKLTVLENLSRMGYSISWITSGIGDMMECSVRENSVSFCTKPSSRIDSLLLFRMLLSELGNVYSEEELKDKPRDFLSVRAFELTMTISKMVDDNVEAVNMAQSLIAEESKNKKL